MISNPSAGDFEYVDMARMGRKTTMSFTGACKPITDD